MSDTAPSAKPAGSSPANTPRIVILGGGFAGAFTARALRKSLAKRAHIEVISDRNYFVFQPLLPEVAAGTINAQDAVAPLRQLLKGVTVRMGEVINIDFDQQCIEIAQGSKRIPAKRYYDELVIALGQRTVLTRFPGFAEHSFCMRDLADAHALRNHVLQCLEHADVTENVELKARLLTFVIAGAGFSGVETAGELHEMLDRALPAYPNVRRDEINTVLIQRSAHILPELDPALGRYAAEKLQKRGVDIRLNTSLARATGTAVYTGDGECIRTHTLVTTVGNGPTGLVETLQLPMQSGRISTDRRMRVQDHVWALGDAAYVPLDDEGAVSAPPTAQFAVRQAKALAYNIVAKVEGREGRDFAYKPRGTMASIGHYRAVAQVLGMRLSGLSAWLLWRGFYIGMLPGLSTRIRVALNWLFDYVLPRSIVQVNTKTTNAARVVHYAGGDVLFAPGQIVDGFYIVITGSLESRVPVDHHVDGPEGQLEDQPEGRREDFVRILGPGDHWGERSLTEGTRTFGSLTAVDDCEVLVLGRTDFAKLNQGLPPFSDYLQRIPEKIYPPALRNDDSVG